MIDRTRAIPGVVSVGAANGVPLVSGGADGSFVIMTRLDEKIDMNMYPLLMKDPTRSGEANFMVVDGNYFDAMGIPVERGRAFRSTDTENAQHVAVISASLAKAKWPKEDPIGKIIQYGNMDGDLRPFTVVGVVGDVRDQNLANPPQNTFYAFLPQRVNAAWNLRVVIQVAGDPTAVIASARNIVHQLRPDLAASIRTMETVVSTSVADRRFALVLVGVFGGVALLLATLGVYSVVSYVVTQRRQEIGVRIALGARRADVLRLVLRQGALLAAAGIVVGGVGAFFLTTFLKGMVYGVSTTDPFAFGGVLLLLAIVALVGELDTGGARRWRRSDERASRIVDMKPSVLYRITAVLLLLFAVAHTLGFACPILPGASTAFLPRCGRRTSTYRGSAVRIGTSFSRLVSRSACSIYSRRYCRGSSVA